MQHSPSQPSGDNVEYSLRHVTVLQVQRSTRVHSTAPFRIDDREFKHVILLGNLCGFEEDDTRMLFTLDDGTGRVRVTKWNKDQTWASQLEVNAFPYVRVIGKAKEYMGQKQVEAIKIEMATSPYEPYHHLLYAIHDTLACQRGPPPRLRYQGNDHLENPDMPESYSSTLLYDLELHQFESEVPLPTWKEPLQAPSSPMIDSVHLSHKEAGPSRDIHSQTWEELQQPLAIPKDEAIHLDYDEPRQSGSEVPQQPLLNNGLGHYPARTRSSFIQRLIFHEIQRNADERPDAWRGVGTSTIVHAMTLRLPGLTKEEFCDAVDTLVEEGYIFNTVNDEYYMCTNLDDLN